MTREEILALDDKRKLDKLVAETIMGYTVYHYDKDFEENCYFMLMFPEGYPANPFGGGRETEEEAWADCPYYSEYINDAWEVEEKIKELRLHVKYCQTLKEVVISTGEYVGLFDYIHATAEQRCKAAILSVLEG